MSVFGSIMSIQDAVNRLPQFEHQVNKLSSESKLARSSSEQHIRSSFIRRCRDLHKQLDEHKKRTEMARTDDAFRKRTAVEQIDELKMRLSAVCPEMERNSSILSDAHSRHSIDESDAEMPRNLQTRRKSAMYANDSESSGDEGKEVAPPTTAPTPAPKPRLKPIEITAPQTQTKPKEPEPQPEQKVFSEVSGNTFQVLKNLEPASHGDLRIFEGDMLEILETRSDGWWMAKNGKEETGWVPKTYLKHVPKPKERSKVAKRLGVRDSVIATTHLLRRGTTPTVQPITTIDVATLIPNAITVWTGKQIGCLGDALRVDHHLSASCHLTPRLSHSNLGFHDLFWNPVNDQVRKRNIRISRLIRMVRLEGMPLTPSKPLIRLALLDESRKRGRQIVSNVHTLQPRVKGTTWHLSNKSEQNRTCLEHADVILRSNYSMTSVMLVIEVSVIIQNERGFEERSLGHIKVGLLDEDGSPKIVSRTYVEILKPDNLFGVGGGAGEILEQHTERRIFFKVMDVGKDKVHFVDSMPDVLIFNALYLPFFYYYRRRAGTLLIRDTQGSEMCSDPLLAVFPEVADQHDLMDAMLSLWSAKKREIAKKSEVDQTIEFFQTFLHTAYFLFGTQIMPNYEIADDVALAGRQKIIKTFVDSLKKGQLRHLLAAQKCKPVNIYDYSLDLMGQHSID